MKHLLPLLFLPLLFSSCNDDTSPAEPASKWVLAWSEEFDYTGLPDPEKWVFETGYVRNNETQYYTDSRLENCRVEDGILHITALNDNHEGHPVTSASIMTQDRKNFHYGLLVVRAKMPNRGSGTWPAIWMLGANYNTVGWPRSGEIDIMEWVGKIPTVVLGSVYSQSMSSPEYTERHWAYVVSNPDILTEEFHNYAIEWDSTKLRFFFDSINYVTYTKSDLGRDWEPFTKEQFLKLNLAMGGFIPPIGGGGDIDYSRFPYTFQVDYVRYYQRRE